MMLRLAIISALLLQHSGRDSELAARIQHLVNAFLTTSDDKEEAAAEAEGKELFRKRGLPTIADVGDEGAYKLVVLTCSRGPLQFQREVLRKARARLKDKEIPSDAVSYCEARIRQGVAETRARAKRPSNPQLRDKIERLFKSDQAVRQKNGFDLDKMARTDHTNRGILEAMFRKYGIPTYEMVGPEAASAFVTMVQHQPTEFRNRVLPKLKQAIDAGQADPAAYAAMVDRLRTDAGIKQIYGENLICDKEHPELHTAPIEDEANVNSRRAAVGLLRLDLYTQLAIRMSPNICGPAQQR